MISKRWDTESNRTVAPLLSHQDSGEDPLRRTPVRLFSPSIHRHNGVTPKTMRYDPRGTTPANWQASLVSSSQSSDVLRRGSYSHSGGTPF
jgi:hypothetical protein